MTERREFPQKVKKAAYKRSGGICECGCGRPFTDHPKERPVYDHILPDGLWGPPTLENCAAIRSCCHDIKTFKKGGDITKIAKAKRGERDRQGLKPKKATLPGSKGGKWKAKIGGGWVRRDEA